MERLRLVSLSRNVHVLLRVAVLLAGLAGASVLPRTAQADVVICRTDPVVSLSDGTNLDLSAAIQDSDTDVQQVSYAIHIPSGVSVLSVLYTDGPLGPKEVLTVSENNPPDIYDVSTVVSTLASHIAVTATAEAVSAVMISSASSSGWDNAPLRVEVSSS